MKRCRRKPCRTRRLRGTASPDCHDLVDKAWKLLQQHHNAWDRIGRGIYGKGTRQEAIAKADAYRAKSEALEARAKALGC